MPQNDGKVVHPSEDDWEKLVKSNRAVILKASARWCGPCRGIAPLYEQQAKIFKDIVFTHVDMDENRNICESYNVTGLPTFVFLLDSVEVGRVVGASPAKLLSSIQNLSDLQNKAQVSETPVEKTPTVENE